MEIRTVRGAIPLNRNGPAGDHVAHEVSDGKIGVQRQVWARERKAACDNGFEDVGCREDAAKMLGRPLGYAVGRGGLKLVECAVVCIGYMSDHRRLRAIDGSGTQEQDSLYAASCGEIQSMAGAVHDCAEQIQRSTAGARCPENGVAEFAWGKCEGAHIASMQQQTWIGSEGRVFRSKSFWIACQHRQTCSELQLAIGVQKAANQPLAKEPGAAGYKDPRATKLFQILSCELHDVSEISLGKRFGDLAGHRKPLLPAALRRSRMLRRQNRYRVMNALEHVIQHGLR